MKKENKNVMSFALPAMEAFRDRLIEESLTAQDHLIFGPDRSHVVLVWRGKDDVIHNLHVDWYHEEMGVARIHLDHGNPLGGSDYDVFDEWIMESPSVRLPRLKLTVLPEEVEKALEWAFDIFKAKMCWCLAPEGLLPVVTSMNPEQEVDYAWSTAAHAKYVAAKGEQSIFDPVHPKQLVRLMN